MKKISGNLKGLKAHQLRLLENLYRRRIPPEFVITPEAAQGLCHISHKIRRQVGLLISRPGKIVKVIVGNQQGIVIPLLDAYRVAAGRLRGIRCVHTHLADEPLSTDDLMDLALLRLDLMAAVDFTDNGTLSVVHVAHILPGTSDEKPYRRLPPLSPRELNIDCRGLIRAIESELAEKTVFFSGKTRKERALLISVTSGISRKQAQSAMDELTALAHSDGLEVVGTTLQQRRRIDARFLMGLGKLKELTISALQKGASMIVFDQELNPSQIRAITDQIELKVIDRSQLILDIFAQRARTREGKLQVELAQLKYLLPRLIEKNTAMSRLTGGIGGRGPGETKLEIHRRRVRDRIVKLEKELELVVKQRRQQKARRNKRGLPIISIVGYTNAGKSTLLNTLTKSNVLTAGRLFATLDPSSRRLKFPRETEVIITDTVGFIKDLPKDLMVAFRATLEELQSAHLLLHVIDTSNLRVEQQIRSVQGILEDLHLNTLPRLRVFNKQDLAAPEVNRRLIEKFGGLSVCAKDPSTLMPMIRKMEKMVLHAKGQGG